MYSHFHNIMKGISGWGAVFVDGPDLVLFASDRTQCNESVKEPGEGKKSGGDLSVPNRTAY